MTIETSAPPSDVRRTEMGILTSPGFPEPLSTLRFAFGVCAAAEVAEATKSTASNKIARSFLIIAAASYPERATLTIA